MRRRDHNSNEELQSMYSDVGCGERVYMDDG